jgi:acyl-CoA synthetase (NDP forming)
MFNPQSIAVIGASRNPKKIGYELVSNILAGGMRASSTLSTPRGADIHGHESYTSVTDVPGMSTLR